MPYVSHLYFLLALTTATATAAEWHVSTSGDDKAAGTSNAPFRTIARGLAVAEPGDTVLLHDGTYRETIAPRLGGRADEVITLINAPGARPVISAFDPVTGPWTAEANGVWSAPAPKAPELADGMDVVRVDGIMQPEARFPNRTSASVMDLDGMDVVMSSNFTMTSPALAGHPAGFFAGTRFIGSIHPAWTAQTARVTGSTDQSLTIEPSSVSTPWWPNKARKGGAVDADADYKTTSSHGVGILFGTRNLLDAPGEWIVTRISSAETLSLLPPRGRAPYSMKIERKTRLWALDFDGVDHWRVSGLRVEGGAIRMKGTGLTIEDCELRHPSHFLSFKCGYSPNGNRTSGTGILVQGQGNAVRHCEIRESAGSGVQLAGSGHLIEQCLIEDVDYSGTYGAGIQLNGSGHRVEFNTIRSTGRDCIAINGGGHRIVYNDLSRSGVLAKDGGMIYTYGQNGDGTQIAYNWLHESGNPDDPKSRGVYIDNYSCGFVIHHNVIWGLGRKEGTCKGIHVGAPSQDIAIYHNTLIGVLPPTVATYSKFPIGNTDTATWTADSHHLLFTYQNNLHLASASEAASSMKDPENGDYRPREGSPAIDPARQEVVKRWSTNDGKSGVPEGFALILQDRTVPFRCEETTGEGILLPGLNDGCDGSSPDNGAYEANRPLWRPGRKNMTSLPITSQGETHQSKD